MSECEEPSGNGRRAWLRRAVSLLIGAAVLGAVVGVLWQWLWTPATGVVFSGNWILAGVEMTREFAGTGWYVGLGLTAGVIWGIIIALRADGLELTNVAVGLLSAVLAGWLMYVVGHALGPADPRPLAKTSDDYTLLPADLRFAGLSSPAFPAPTESPVFAVWPLGTATVLAAAYGFSTGPARPRRGEKLLAFSHDSQAELRGDESSPPPTP